MKRIDLIKHLMTKGCLFLREGARHTVFLNPLPNRTSTVPRHNEIDNNLAKKICKDLGVVKPTKR